MNRPPGYCLVPVPKKGFREGSARSFSTKIKGRVFQGLVVKKNGKYFAYQNLCQHLPITLDLKDDNFFTHDRKFLQCHMHGAMYELETGHCVAGPCEGANLVLLPVVEEESRLIVQIPQTIFKK